MTRPRFVVTPEELDRGLLHGLRVLCIDDDPVAREVMGHFLRRTVATVELAADGDAAIASFEARSFDLVITDIEMPGMDGLSLAERLRVRAPRVPIIVATAFENPDYLLRAIDLGIDKYVTKPVDATRLHATLLAVARQLRAEAALAEQHRAEIAAVEGRHLESIGLLAGGMAHDFNNLLQLVLLNLELVGDRVNDDPDTAGLLGEARDSALRASQLGEKLRVLASGGLVASEPTRVDTLLRAATTRALAGSDVRCVLEIADALPVLRVDARLLIGAFEQLARNAVEAMPNGGTLTIHARPKAIPAPGTDRGVDEGVEIELRDTGPGVDPELLPAIFEPYVTSKSRGVERGRGLGLSICRAIVRKHGGYVQVTSNPGEGACFTVQLPAMRRHSTPAPSAFAFTRGHG